MRWLARIVLALLAIIVIGPLLLIAAAFIGLNTAGGRAFVVQEVNHYETGSISITNLGGHFPTDLKLAHLEISDAKGVWLTGNDLELRWSPAALLTRTLHVTALTATDISAARAPQAAPSKSNGGGLKLPAFKIDVDRLAIDTLNLDTALAGQPTTLTVTGSARLQNLTQGDLTLDATAANNAGAYHVQAALDPKIINTTIHISEPPDGLLGHYAGPRVHAPLTLDLTLAGPRNAAALNFSAALGTAQLDGAGVIGLDPQAPAADVTFTVPALAPFAAIAAQNIAGHTKLHLVARQTGDGATIALDGDLALTTAPGPAARLVGPDGHLALLVRLANNQVQIENLAVGGAGFTIAANGAVAQTGIDLQTHLTLTDVTALSPAISGQVSEDGTIAGTPKDFAVSARLAGDIAERRIPSGPFELVINAQHLPSAPNGTIAGSGALEGSPLVLDAQFARNAAGAASLVINKALWRSLNLQGNLATAAGATMPTGQAKFTLGRLQDFDNFSPVKLSGSVAGDFSHPNDADFAFNLQAHQLVAAPALGAIDAQVTAAGPSQALAIKFSATIAKLLGAPARVALQGAVNVPAGSATLATLSATWKQVNAKLLGPAAIQTKPGLAVHHLALALNGGTIDLDGALTPRLNLNLALKNLPADLAALAAPTLNISGSLDMTAALTGTPAAPAGKIALAAHRIKLHGGTAGALPPADLQADIALAGKTANLDASLGIGPNVNLNADGLVPLTTTGPLALHLTGTTDLRLLDAIIAAEGSSVRGVITPDLTITGTPAAPRASGTVVLAGGAVQNIGSGLNLTSISARIQAAGRLVTLASLQATAGPGRITGSGSLDLGTPNLPIDLAIEAHNATPVTSDLVTENLDAALTLTGFLQGGMALAGDINIIKARIDIPKSLPPSVANLPILNRGAPPAPPAPPPPDVRLNLTARAANQIFIRGDGLFAELGGTLTITGTAADPDPEGGFTLIRGNFALAGKTLQFTKGVVSFNGAGFMPTLDLEASSTAANNTTATLVIGGTAAHPTITLSATPPLPPDEVLSQLLFGQATSSLSPFQAASLAAALASLSGIGGSVVADPLGGVRNALGLDELSVGGSGSGAPTVNAGRYVAPGVYVGAQQSTSGQGTQATVQINLYKGLQLQTATGTGGSGSGASSSVGLTYQFNY